MIASTLRDLIAAWMGSRTLGFRLVLMSPPALLARPGCWQHTRNRGCKPCDRSIDIRFGRPLRKVEPDPQGEPRCIRTVRDGADVCVPAAT